MGTLDDQPVPIPSAPLTSTIGRIGRYHFGSIFWPSSGFGFAGDFAFFADGGVAAEEARVAALRGGEEDGGVAVGAGRRGGRGRR